MRAEDASHRGPLRLDAYFDDTYDFYRWVGTGIKYTLNVAQGVLLGAPYGPDRA